MGFDTGTSLTVASGTSHQALNVAIPQTPICDSRAMPLVIIDRTILITSKECEMDYHTSRAASSSKYQPLQGHHVMEYYTYSLAHSIWWYCLFQ